MSTSADMYEAFMTKFMEYCAIDGSEVLQTRKIVDDIWRQIGLYDRLNVQYKTLSSATSAKIPLKVTGVVAPSHPTMMMPASVKKAPNAWNVFRVARYKELKEQGIGSDDALKQMGAEWKEKSKEEQEAYKTEMTNTGTGTGASASTGASNPKVRKTCGYRLFSAYKFKSAKETKTKMTIPTIAQLWRDLPDNERAEWNGKANIVNTSPPSSAESMAEQEPDTDLPTESV